MNEQLLNALDKLPVFAGISYRCLTIEDPMLPGAFVTASVVPTTLASSALTAVPGLRTVVAFLNRTARDVSLLAPGGQEVAVMPECAFRTVGEVDLRRSLTIRLVEEIVDAAWPDPAWPQDFTTIMEHITTALAAPPASINTSRYTGPFALIPATGG